MLPADMANSVGRKEQTTRSHGFGSQRHASDSTAPATFSLSYLSGPRIRTRIGLASARAHVGLGLARVGLGLLRPASSSHEYSLLSAPSRNVPISLSPLRVNLDSILAARLGLGLSLLASASASRPRRPQRCTRHHGGPRPLPLLTKPLSWAWSPGISSQRGAPCTEVAMLNGMSLKPCD